MRRLMQARSVPLPPRAATPTAKMTPAAATVEKPRLEPAKDYIHVRARLGQATDSHSLAERVRRERISKRMKIKPALSSSLTLRGGRDGGSDRDALISPMEDLICDLAA